MVSGIIRLFFCQKDSTKAALAKFLEDIVFVEVVIVFLVFEDVLLVKIETGPAEKQRTRHGLFIVFLRVASLVEKCFPHLALRAGFPLLNR